MDKISYKGKIDTYLLLLENLNIKAGLSGIAWRVRVESKLPDEILRRPSAKNIFPHVYHTIIHVAAGITTDPYASYPS